MRVRTQTWNDTRERSGLIDRMRQVNQIPDNESHNKIINMISGCANAILLDETQAADAAAFLDAIEEGKRDSDEGRIVDGQDHGD